jgi:L-iditol 2-dehydrogenase
LKVAVLTGRRRIEIREVPDPHLGKESDALLRVEAVGVCGSDVHYYSEGRIGNQIVEYPFMVGHECAGIVEKVGRAVTRLKPGDRIAVDPAVVCGACDQCLVGRANTCRNLLFLGTPGQSSGCMCEYIVMPEQNCHPAQPGNDSGRGSAC